ncbi:glycoside hydrolase/deacetylase, partial [Ascobolus immersus RN42]
APGVLVSQCSTPGTVAITFDDGPYKWTEALLDSLNKAKVKVTWFMNGDFYGCIYKYAEVVQKAYKTGHQIASHTWSHPDLTNLTREELVSEFTRNEVAFGKILGVKPTWVRPPYFYYNDTVLEVAKELGYRIVTLNFDSADWSGLSAEEIKARYEGLEEGSDRLIVLAHDAIETTAVEVGTWVADWAKKRGLKMVTLSECVGERPEDAYVKVGKPEKRNKSWTCEA